MKIIVLSPNIKILFTEEQVSLLSKIGELILVEKVQPFENVSALFEKGEKVVAIDPDFCDWKVPNEIIDKIVDLKAICLQTTSFSWMDINHAKEKNIPVMNLRGFSTEAVAEYAFMMTLLLARKIPVIIKEGWKQDYSKHQGIELKGKTAGIIGFGSIGTRIAELCDGFGMKVVYWSKNSRDPRFELVKDVRTLLCNADVIFPSVAQNNDTNGMITNGMLKMMKKEAIFVSVVHHVYDHALLLDMTANNKIYGYGFEESTATFNNYKGNVMAAPELAWTTDGSMKRNAAQWVESIVKAINRDYLTRVN